MLLAGGVSALAQGQGGQGGQGRQRGGGQFDPEQMRQRMMERYQERLEASDAEWQVIEPLLGKVMEAQRGSMGGRFGGMMFMGRRGGDQQEPAGGGQQGRQGRRPGGMQGSEQVQALGEVLQQDNPSAAEIKDKLAAVRAERKKQEAELKTARENLRKVLTLKQEAMLVLAGTLD
jgi:hypothetical protein